MRYLVRVPLHLERPLLAKAVDAVDVDDHGDAAALGILPELAFDHVRIDVVVG